ncbi:MAG: DnaJ domain-containing protein [Legionellaceae bacterium]|nr:DnaJ domain-containing protein [Legionellaceae bacterium]
MHTHYEVLGVPVDATQRQITVAFRKLALIWHPDKYKGSDPKEARKNFDKISAAYETLNDPATRKKYDEDELELNSSPRKSSKPTASFRPSPQDSYEKEKSNSSTRHQPTKPANRPMPSRRQEDEADAYYVFYSFNKRPENFVPPMKKTCFVYRTTSPLDKLFDAIEKEWKAIHQRPSFKESPRVTKHADHVAVNVNKSDIQHMEKVIDNLIFQLILLELIATHLPKAKDEADNQCRSNLSPRF